MPDFVLTNLFWIVPLLAVGIGLACSLAARHWGKGQGERSMSMAFAVVFILIIAATFALRFKDGFPSWPALLPWHFCDWGMLAALFVFLHRDTAKEGVQTAFEIAYFFILGSTAHAFLTPVIAEPGQLAWVVLFYVTHAALLAGVVFLVFGRRLRPAAGAIWRVFLWVQIWGFSALAVNFLLGTNFGFLNAKPDEDTLFNLLWDWPWYLFQLEALALISILVLNLPFSRWQQGAVDDG